MSSPRDERPPIVFTAVLRCGHSISNFLSLLLVLAAAMAILFSRGVLEPSPAILVLAISAAFSLWVVFPRRWFIVRRLTAFVFMTLFIGCATVGYQYLRSRTIQQSVDSITARGSSRVFFDYEWVDEAFLKTKNGWQIPTWCSSLLGDCMFAQAYRIDLYIDDDNDLPNMFLDPVIEVAEVQIAGDSVTDVSLLALCAHKRLKKLCIVAPNITDNGLRHLSQLSSLENVSIEQADVSDACVKHLKQLRNLKSLSIHGQVQITAAGVADIQQALPSCRIRVYLRKPEEKPQS